jgi:uncharacterized protein YndB with AHSA1/START domain
MARTQTHEIVLNGTLEDVWKLLTEAEGLTRWFVPEARVNPGLGGTVFVSWGEGMSGEGKIHLWEPAKAFGWTESGPAPKLVEFFLEGAGGQTKLRLVQSGFGEGAQFDDEYDAVMGGWRTFLGTMAFGLANHGLNSCEQVAKIAMAAGNRADIVARISTQLGFAEPLSGIAVGQAYRAELPVLGTIQGTRLDPDKEGYYLLTLDNWDRSVAALFFEKFGDQIAVTQQWFLFGAAREKAAALRAELARWLTF